MSLSLILPEEGLPPTGYPVGQALEWFFQDDLVGYRKRGGHPIYGEHDVVYRFNSLGYRCPEFCAKAEVRVVAIGCSYVFGLGLPQEDLFPERFAAKLQAVSSKSVILWNLGLSGASNDYITRVLHFAVPQLDPNIVLIHFTHPGRREYISVENEYIKFLPSHTPSGEIARDIFRHLTALSSPYDNELNFFKNYKAIELILADRCWLYSQCEWMKTHAYMDLSRYVGILVPIDRARDGDHPGPKSHKLLAAQYWDKFIHLRGLEYLSR